MFGFYSTPQGESSLNRLIESRMRVTLMQYFTKRMKNQSKSSQGLFLTSLLLSGISFRTIGDIYLTEIVLAAVAVKSILAGRKVFNKNGCRYIPGFIFCWCFGNLVSSLLNGKSLSLFLIAIATPVITGLVLRSVLEYFENYPSQILKALSLFAVGRLIGAVLNPLPYTKDFPWKFGFGDWVILLALILAVKRESNRVLWFFAPLLAFVSLVNEARSMTLFIISALVVTFFTPRKRMTVAFLFILAVLPIFSYYAYLDLALSGNLGVKENARARLLSESELGPLSARKEFIFSSRAFAGSPVVGYGFDPQVNREILEAGNQQLLRSGVKVDNSYLSELPMHSFLMSAVVQGGFLAGFIWISAFITSSRSFLLSIELPRHERAIAVYISLVLMSKILFSPFGAFERLNFAFLFSFILVTQSHRIKNDG
jgi:hypothetical protein